MLRKGEVQLEWDEAIFNFTLEKAIVHKDKSITFKFYSGYETPYLLKNSNIFTFVNFFTILKSDEFNEPGCKGIESSPEGNLIKHS